MDGEDIFRGENETSGDAGWDEVADLAGKMEDETLDVELEQQKIEQMYRREVFTNVNSKAVERTIEKPLERIDGKELLDLSRRIAEDFESGIDAAEEYFARALDLKRKPALKKQSLSKGVLAHCKANFTQDTPDVIAYDVDQIGENNEDLLTTLGHENWHAFQFQEVRERDNRHGSAGLRASCYVYNCINYIDGKDDVQGYVSQLLEKEAYRFEDRIKGKLKDAKIAEFAEAHPEIYGEENLTGIDREMEKVFSGLDMDDFLTKMGVGSVTEFIESIDTSEGVELEQKYVDALLEMVGCKIRPKVKEEDIEAQLAAIGLPELVEAIMGQTEYPTVSEDMHVIHVQTGADKHDLFLRELPKSVWRLRQKECMSGALEGERAELYKSNVWYLVRRGYDKQLHERQLLMREQREFMERWMDILDEQALMEEVAKMPLPKHVLVKMQAKRKGMLSLSKKYHVKREKL